VLAQLLEPPCTDPYARWCGRGGAARLPPIPIIGTFRTSRDVRLESAFGGKVEVGLRGRQVSFCDPSRTSSCYTRDARWH
jgi:hypothetical protein